MPKPFRGDIKLYLILLVAAVLCIYGNTIQNGFILVDDPINITKNSLVQNLSITSLLHIWQKPIHDLYIPITYTFWALLALLSKSITGKIDPLFFHSANIILHALNTLLVFYVISLSLTRLDNDEPINRANIAALIGATIFVFHPAMVEPVAWATGAKDLLSTFFSLIALYLFLKQSNRLLSREWNNVRPVMSTLFYTIALLAKPSAVVLPAVTLLILFSGIRVITTKKVIILMKQMLPWFVVGLCFSIGTILLQHGKFSSAGIGFIDRIISLFFAIGFYSERILFPYPLSIDYGYPISTFQTTGKWMLYPLCALLIFLFLYFRKNKKAWSAFGIFVVCIFPVSGIIGFEFERISVVADRYLYMAMLGPAIGIAWFLEKLPPERFKKVCLMLVPIIAVWILISISYQSKWKNTKSLMEQTLAVNPQSHTGNHNMGVYLMRKGLPQKALPYLKRACMSDPSGYLSRYNLIIAYTLCGDMESAKMEINRLKKQNPDLAINLERLIPKLYKIITKED